MYLGIDIGGTKTLIALFSARGRILRRQKFPTPTSQKLFQRDLVKNLQSFTHYNIRSIAVAIPGVIKNHDFIFGNRNWTNLDLHGCLKNLFTAPIYFENDANLGALYESKISPKPLIYLTFSTGIGGGICEKSQLLPHSKTFEPGHKKYLFNGRELEWEDIAAASAIVKSYHVDRVSTIRAQKSIQDIAARLNLGLKDIINEYHPNIIIIGGPLAFLFPHFKKYLYKSQNLTYRRAKRPTESTIYGCYLLAKSQD